MVVAVRAELDEAKRKTLYRDIALMVRDEGGAIIPVFNDWVDAVSDKVGGYQPHPAGELMSSMALVSCFQPVAGMITFPDGRLPFGNVLRSGRRQLPAASMRLFEIAFSSQPTSISGTDDSRRSV